jgi:hypothetical protein
MDETRGELTAVVDAGPGYDAEELADLAQGLRGELLELDVETVTAASAGAAPEGAKGPELLIFGSLAIKLAALASPTLRSVIGTIEEWLGRAPARSVKLSLDGDTLEVTGVSSDQQSALVEQWIARHAGE